jgi:hypothetical protein
MTPDEMKTVLDGLPMAKKATPAQMVLLAICCFALIYTGVKAGVWFSDGHKEIMAGISAVDVKVDAVKQSQEWLRASTISRAEMTLWASQLDKANRKLDAGMGLNVPDVPARTAPASTPGR